MVIYKITNLINNKIYIGQTTQDFRNYRGSGRYLRLAKLKYGWINFKKEILVEGDFNKCLLDSLEKHYIRLYNSSNKTIGYNLTEGGSSSGTKSAGRKHSLETIEKMKASRAGSRPPQKAWEEMIKVCSKPVLQYDLNGVFISEFISLSEASKKTNSRIQEIWRVCKEKRKSHNGFVWKYKINEFPLKINKMTKSNKWITKKK